MILNSPYISGSSTITGNLLVLGNITGSTNSAISASYANNATSASYALNATTSSYATNADLLDGRDSLTFANTGSNSFVGSQNINGSVAITGSLTTTGAITAQTLNVQQVTSSIVYSSGSNIFGNSVSNTQSMTGSVGITGSLSVNGVSTLSGALTGTSATMTTSVITDLIKARTNVPLVFQLSDATPVANFSNTTGGLSLLYGLTGTSATLSGKLAFSANSGATASGQIGRDAIYGMFQWASSGTTDDWTVFSPSLGYIMHVPTGTVNTVFAGNVGIGTTTPQLNTNYGTFLTVQGTNASGWLELATTSTTDGNGGIITFNNTNIAGSDKRVASIYGIRDGANNSAYIGFSTNNAGSTAERMRITSGGNVGIGTESPNSYNSAANQLVVGTNSGNNGITIAGGTSGFSSIYLADGTTGNEAFRGYIEYAHSSDYLAFGTAASECMRITSGGSMHVGAAIDSAAISTFVSGFNGFAAKVSNNAFFLYSGLDSSDVRTFYVLGTGDVKNTNNSYGAISDVKLKENIKDATPKLDNLLKVKIRNYNLIGDDKKQIGVIAQELEEIFPTMVDELEDFEELEVPQIDKEGNEVLNQEGKIVTTKQRVSKGTATKSVKYSVFVPMLIKAIQELEAKIKILESK
jgi:hypothetical protein